MIDNIIIGDMVDGLTNLSIGILPSENNFIISKQEAIDMNRFLPSILVTAGLFKSTSEIKKIAATRKDSKKIKDVDSKLLWRNIDKPELTQFKIGKKSFWLVVGDINK